MVLIFILKNSTDEIKANLKLMFSSYFETGTNQYNWNTTNINTLKDDLNSLFNKKTKDNTTDNTIDNTYTNYINKYILPCLTEDQQNCFKILAVNNYEKIQDQLYLRLRDKSCYVFQVLNSDKVVVVGANNSADEAFRSARTSVKKNETFIINSLNPSVFLPKYTYCAIDAPLKHGLSLSNYPIRKLDSRVYVTAVTRNDAAGQNMLYAGQYTKPICITIDVQNIPTNSIKPYFDFTYEYKYGNPVSNKDKIIDVPDIIKDTELVENYKNIIMSMNNRKIKFYPGKNRERLQDAVADVIDKLLYIVGKKDDKIREALSKLYEKTKVGTKNNKITEEKEKFISFFNKYITDPDEPRVNKAILINYTTQLLEFMNVKNVNDVTGDIASFLAANAYELEGYNNNQFITPAATVTGTGRGRGKGTGTGRGTYQGKDPGPEKKKRGGAVEQLRSDGLLVENINGDYNKPDISQISTLPSKFPIETTEADLNNLAEGVASLALKSDETQDEIQYSYSTLFGKYGFDMAINEDGEYELHILDTEEQYNAYLRKYGLQREGQTGVAAEGVGQQAVGQQTEQAAEGGKRKKTKKHKRVKHNTRRVPKLRLNKSKRKVVRKATKTRSK
jgi:hypothetical protein